MSFLILLYFSFNFFLHFNYFLSIQIRDIIVLFIGQRESTGKVNEKATIALLFSIYWNKLKNDKTLRINKINPHLISKKEDVICFYLIFCTNYTNLQ